MAALHLRTRSLLAAGIQDGTDAVSTWEFALVPPLTLALLGLWAVIT